MKKPKQYTYTSFGGEKVTVTIDENLNKLKGKNLAPKKLAEANAILRNMKTPLPK